MAAIVQSTEARSTGSVDLLQLAYDSNVVAGNILIVCAQSFTDQLETSEVSDSQVNTYQMDVEHQAHSGSAAIYSSKAGSSAANTVTLNPGSDSFLSLILIEASGLAGASWFDTSVEGSGSSSAPSAGTLTTGGSNGLAVWHLFHASGLSPTLTPPADWTEVEEEEDTTFNPWHVAYRLTDASTGYSTTGSTSDSVNWIVVAANFKADASTGYLLVSN